MTYWINVTDPNDFKKNETIVVFIEQNNICMYLKNKKYISNFIFKIWGKANCVSCSCCGHQKILSQKIDIIGFNPIWLKHVKMNIRNGIPVMSSNFRTIHDLLHVYPNWYIDSLKQIQYKLPYTSEYKLYLESLDVDYKYLNAPLNLNQVNYFYNYRCKIKFAPIYVKIPENGKIGDMVYFELFDKIYSCYINSNHKEIDSTSYFLHYVLCSDCGISSTDVNGPIYMTDDVYIKYNKVNIKLILQ